MAKKKFQLTAFARFFLAMIIIAPLAFLGASYYNGEDGIQNFKNLIGFGESTEQVQSQPATPAQAQTTPPPSEEYINSRIKKLEDEMAEKDARSDKLYLENEELKKQLKEKELELQSVKDQLDKIKSAIGQ